MREEGLPLIWSRAGVILSIVQLKERGELAEAAALAKQGAEFAAVALGTDSSVYLRFERLATAFAAAASAEPSGQRRRGGRVCSSSITIHGREYRRRGRRRRRRRRQQWQQ